MSIDGANIGVPGEEAVKAALGGEQPKTKLSKDEILARVLAIPDDYAQMKSYNDGCYWLAKQFYLLRKDGVEGDPHELYVAMQKKCGDRDYGFTGFMVGWANNCSRWLLGMDEVKNPAIMTIEG